MTKTKTPTAAAALAAKEAAYMTAYRRWEDAGAAIVDAEAEQARIQTVLANGGDVTTDEIVTAPAMIEASKARQTMLEPAVATAWAAVLVARAESVRAEVLAGAGDFMTAAQLHNLIDAEAVKVAEAAQRIEALADAANVKLEQLWYAAKDSAAAGGDHGGVTIVRNVAVSSRSGDRVLTIDGVEHQALNSFDIAEQIGARAGILAAN